MTDGSKNGVVNDDHYRVLAFAGGIMCEGGVNPEKKSKYM